MTLPRRFLPAPRTVCRPTPHAPRPRNCAVAGTMTGRLSGRRSTACFRGTSPRRPATKFPCGPTVRGRGSCGGEIPATESADRSADRGAVPPGRDGEQRQAVRGRRGLPAVGHVQLPEDVGHVHAGGLHRDEQRLGDVAVAAALRDQAQHLVLARRQPQRRRGLAAAGGAGAAQQVGDAFAERDCAEAVRQLLRGAQPGRRRVVVAVRQRGPRGVEQRTRPAVRVAERLPRRRGLLPRGEVEDAAGAGRLGGERQPVRLLQRAEDVEPGGAFLDAPQVVGRGIA